MDDTTDLLQIKIEKAKSQLTDETLNAIDAIDWKDAILKMRVSKGYSFEQLGALETETELVLCGLLNPKDYSKELEHRMGISKAQTNELVNEMNKQVFSRIKEELIKSSEGKDVFVKKETPENTYETNGEEKRTTQILNTAGIEILPKELELNSGSPEEGNKTAPSILAQKLSTPVQTPPVKTDHSLPGITPPSLTTYPKNGDPYRLPPE